VRSLSLWSRITRWGNLSQTCFIVVSTYHQVGVQPIPLDIALLEASTHMSNAVVPTKVPPILLVEDDEHDILLMRRGFAAARIQNPLFIACDGEHAIELLTKVHNRPCLIITDVKMPRVDGFELLIWLQTQPHLRDVPRVVLSGSVLEEDLSKSLLLGATAYFTKPTDPDVLLQILEQWRQTYLESALCA
jgi:CheY-like chemotaxis protein